ncbi:MAG: hypothetical protein KIT84_26500 [Labilithrix sp.]|nr:hypothetical protein [Labilithrix sp.]MCW5814604.1 hypothetical protein [Labilithrix sp.]
MTLDAMPEDDFFGDDTDPTSCVQNASNVALLEKLIVDTKKDKRTGEDRYVIRPTSANVATILQHYEPWRGVIANDTFSGRIVATRTPPWHELDAPDDARAGPWTDADTVRLTHLLARTRVAGCPPITVSTKVVDAAILVASDANKVHPVRSYLRGLRWDGTERLALLAHRYLGCEDTPVARAIGECFMIGAVARVLSPGCKNDLCPIIEGPQGKKKSTFLERLAHPWFSDTKIPIGEKDAFQQLPGKWIYELSELASLSRSDLETTKAFISSRVDRYRPSYGRHEVEMPRQTQFVGTTNAGQYLHDPTGGRRFPPLRIGEIDLSAVERDRDQLWAEATHRYDAGEAWWLDGRPDAAIVAPAAAAETEERFVRHPWEVPIADHLKNPRRKAEGVTTEDLLGACGVDTAHRTTSQAMTVGGILARLGWERRRTMISGKRSYRYFPKEEA